jgi:hypothetical protein
MSRLALITIVLVCGLFAAAPTQAFSIFATPSLFHHSHFHNSVLSALNQHHNSLLQFHQLCMPPTFLPLALMTVLTLTCVYADGDQGMMR